MLSIGQDNYDKSRQIYKHKYIDTKTLKSLSLHYYITRQTTICMLKAIYQIVWEMKQKTLIDMSAERAPFIDQSQSLNLFVQTPNHSIMTTLHFHAWKRGLKTGMYYLRTGGASVPIQFTVDSTTFDLAVIVDKHQKEYNDKLIEDEFVCALRKPGMKEDEECLVCGS